MKRSALLPLTAAAGAVTARQLYDAAFAREDPALVRTVKQLRPGHGHSRRYFQLRDAAAEAARDIFAQHAPDAEINLLSGGQPIYYYLISAE